MSQEMSEYLEKLAGAVEEGDIERTKNLAEEYIKNGYDAYKGITDGLAKGVGRVGDRYGRGEAWLPDMIVAADAMNEALKILLPHIKKDAAVKPARMVLGTIEGDIHDIGKNLVSSMLTAAGLEVHDIGIDMPAEAFIDKAKELEAEIVGISALLTTTMKGVPKVIEYAKKIGYRDKVKILVGGAPTSLKWARSIGADGWAPDAISAVDAVKKLRGEGQ